jgi:class 3 adenylate cyclase
VGESQVTRDAPLDLAGFLALYPWPADMVARNRPIEWLFHFDLPAPPTEVWPYVADNSRFGRFYGANPIVFEEKQGVRYGRATYGGFRHAWVEEPWQWVAARDFVLVRDYFKGPPYLLREIYRLEAIDGGAATRLYIYYGFVPRNIVGKVGIRLWFPGLRSGYVAAVERMRAGLGAPVEEVFRAPPTPIGESGRTRLVGIREGLVARGVDGALLDRLIDHVTSADDLLAYRIQVRRLARQWRVDERALLEVFLHATRAGMLDLSWDVICPHCRGVRQEAGTLADVAEQGSCEVCDIDFATGADNAVEITFHVHPSIRRVEKVLYCSAEPASKAHIKLQQHLAAGERRELVTALQPGVYRVRARGDGPAHQLEVADGGAARLAFAIGRAPEPTRVAPGATVVLDNPTDGPASVVIEELAWADDALRPAQLFNLQAFRDLFGEEYLGAAVQLSVGEQTILFTDIVGSTRYYTEVGDPVAFVAVKNHFAAVFDAVRTAGGAVVKTIGDAVMASFADPVDALRAAAEIHRRMDGGPTSPAPVRVRISLNRGPCIAVNLNSGIDFFGSTVNTAAKLQRCAEAGEIAIGEPVWRAPGVADWVAASGLPIRETTLHHEAFGQVAVFVAGEPPAQAAAERSAKSAT